MKLKFKNQDFQTEATAGIVDLFRGQEKKYSTFSIVQEAQINLLEGELGIGNELNIDDTQILVNMQEIQRRHGLPQTSWEGTAGGEMGAASRCQFSVEMETGTGKTYVYTKTIFELNRQYGFTKFIIVVPSVAIREGVFKSFEITREHFAAEYDNVPYRFFIYNSAKLSEVRRFATASDIEVMIINIDAFKKSENIINQAQDKLNGESAMRYIQDTKPIVIIDEPQVVDNTDKAKEAIQSLNPLCVLRYSATHREKINLMYRLTPVDAYQMGLVKQIAVASNEVSGDFNKPYIRLVSVSNENGFSAKLELDVSGKDGKVNRKVVTVKPNSDLFVLSGERDLYDGYSIAGIDCTQGMEGVEFTNTEFLRLGQTIGGIDEMILKKAQIRRTIELHLEKELLYHSRGIKVLSLFFIDRVEKYRDYEAEDKRGVYAKIFEDCYDELIALPKFAPLRDIFYHPTQKVHNGYFSQDKKGNFKNTKGDTLDDTGTYNTIMRDKEWLLSFDCPLRFIWSHSALKEGWDNPNVFQVCTLIEQKSAFTCRQKIGRGLRLCVDQNGERVEDKNINTLHVIANESFAEFADNLQKEIEQETGMKFGILQIGMFANLTYIDRKTVESEVTNEEAETVLQLIMQNGECRIENPVEEIIELLEKEPEVVQKAVQAVNTDNSAFCIINSALTKRETVEVERVVSYDDAKELMTHFEQKGYVSKTGKMKDTMKNALLSGNLDLPAKFEAARTRLETVVRKADNNLPIRNASRDVMVKLNKAVIMSPEFMEIWNRIKQKTAYRVNVDEARLKELCVKALKEMEPIPKARIISKTASLNIQHAGITHTETGLRTTDIEENRNYLPDFLKEMDDECFMPQSMYIDILFESGRAQDFLNNPQLFMERFIEILHNAQHDLEIDGISYIKLDGEEYYIQEIFDSEELMANLDKNAVSVRHSVYDHIIYDSGTVERPFAVALDNDPDVKMFFKIPERFKIDTPIGSYNPDWAVYMDKDGVQKLFFVLETKGSTSMIDLRTVEQQKIHCGKAHFNSLGDGIDLKVASSWNSFKMNI